MPGLRVWPLMIGLVLALAGPGQAQDQFMVPPQILTLDQERLFVESRAAEAISEAIEAAAAELAAENRAIETELTAEELNLTELRPTLDPGEFRALADAFDEKVQNLRDEQDAKALELQRRRDQERQTFFRQITPILAEIVRERRAFAVLDRRSLILSADSIDITAEAVARINAAFDEEGLATDDQGAPGANPPPGSDGITVVPGADDPDGAVGADGQQP